MTTYFSPSLAPAEAPASPRPPTPDHRTDPARQRWPGAEPIRWALPALLAGTALLYLWGLSESGWANSFYAAAAQAGSASWKAFFFGSSDAANAITVDKTPLSLWPMALSIRVFGLSSWSLLVPQALEGVAAVWLLHNTVRRTTGSRGAALLAGAVLALTPVAVLMFRFDNPDALLVLLLVGAAYGVLRAIEDGCRHPVRWLALAGTLVGLAFLTKMLQAFLVLPGFGLAYLLFAAAPWGKRILHLLVAFGSMLLAAGWWVAIVELWPADSRPWIGGSQNNSILELTFGYNGLGRITGDETGSVGGGGGWGTTGLLRMFGSEVGGQIAWLLPAALILGVAALVVARRRRLVAAATTLWLGWLLVTLLTFSLMAGIFHAYYTVALAPAIAALVAIGALALWQRRDHLAASATLAATVAFTSVWAFALLDRTDWQPWLKYAVVALGLVSALLLAGVRHLPRTLGRTVAGVALVAALAGPTAYSLSTAASPHTGAIPTAGPTTSQGLGGGMGGGPGGAPRGFTAPGGTTGQAAGKATGQSQASSGGLLTGSTSSSAITTLLQEDASSYTWVAAAVGSNSAAGYQLASELPVMAIGGFNGSDPSPTLAEFQQLVANGEIHWFIGSGTSGGMGGGPGTGNSEIATWVAANFEAQTVDGVTLYDFSSGTTA